MSYQSVHTGKEIDEIYSDLLDLIAQINENYAGGWKPFTPAVTYSAFDNPTGVVTIAGDYSSTFKAGIRFKFTNNNHIIYAIVSKNSTYSSLNTTVTFLQEMTPDTNTAKYTLIAGITDVYYAPKKSAPIDFPMETQKWTIKKIDSTNKSVTSPNSTYKTIGVSQDFPIGAWDGDYSLAGNLTTTGTESGFLTTLSSSSTSESNSENSAFSFYGDGTTNGKNYWAHIVKRFTITLESKTTYYLLMKAQSTVTALLAGGVLEPTIIRAVFAYL